MSSKILPFFLFVVMLLPRIKRVFQSGQLISANAEPNNQDGAHRSPSVAGWSVLSLLTLLFLIVACSNLVVDRGRLGPSAGVRLRVASLTRRHASRTVRRTGER